PVESGRTRRRPTKPAQRSMLSTPPGDVCFSWGTPLLEKRSKGLRLDDARRTAPATGRSRRLISREQVSGQRDAQRDSTLPGAREAAAEAVISEMLRGLMRTKRRQAVRPLRTLCGNRRKIYLYRKFNSR